MCFLDFSAACGVHQKDAANALTLVLGCVVNICAGLERAAVYAEKRKFAHIGIRHDFERKRGKGRIIRAFGCDGFCPVKRGTLRRRNVQR